MIKKNIFQIKRTEELKILQQSELEKDSKIKSYRKKALPIIRKPLKSQLVENLFIPSLNEKELQIQKKEEIELIRLYIPIPEFVIERIKYFQIFALEKRPLIIQNINKIEYIPKK